MVEEVEIIFLFAFDIRNVVIDSSMPGGGFLRKDGWETEIQRPLFTRVPIQCSHKYMRDIYKILNFSRIFQIDPTMRQKKDSR